MASVNFGGTHAFGLWHLLSWPSPHPELQDLHCELSCQTSRFAGHLLLNPCPMGHLHEVSGAQPGKIATQVGELKKEEGGGGAKMAA